FAALYDARRRRYLVEDHPLRFAVSLGEAGRQPRPAGTGQSALFVADPAFDRRANPGLERLPAAADEVSVVAVGYRHSRVLSGARATATALSAELGRTGMLHYAGHAVFDDERPERSFLLTAPDPGGAGPPVLTASAIAQLDLRNLSLVVLSACETVRTGEGRAAGFSGLAGAFLAAGAGGVLGSVWEVDDDRTRAFMTEFHRSYRTTGDAASSLAATQRRLLRSPDPALRSPAAWAVFRYAGNSPPTR
ncbi:MAG TPA: CHAT domain-containing protein, partial [Longimicrobium sp.]